MLEVIVECCVLEEFSLKGGFRFMLLGLVVIGFKCGGLVRLVFEFGVVNIDLVLKIVVNGC